MVVRDVTIDEVSYASLTDDDIAQLNVLQNVKMSEELPDDPLRPLEQTIGEIRSVPAITVVHDFWARSDDGSVVANTHGRWNLDDANRHLVRAEIYVHPDHRRRGLGTDLLRRLVHIAEEDGRTTIMAVTSNGMPSGEPFARTVGATVGMHTHNNRLKLADLDLELMKSWVADGPVRAKGYSLIWVTRPFPNDVMDQMAEVMNVMNTQPREDLEWGDELVTVEMIREHDEANAARGLELWYLVARHDVSGKFVGYTEVEWSPFRATIVSQGDTAVHPDHRGHALGKWLKASMALRILEERPEAEQISTGNADSNDAMLGINHAMGFKPNIAAIWWNLRVENAKDYLAGRSST